MSLSLEQVVGYLLGAAFATRTLDANKSMTARVGYGLVGYDLITTAYKGAPLMGAPNGAQRTNLVGGRPANGPTPKFEERRVRTIDERVKYVHEQAVKGTRDPQVYALAREILARKCGSTWCVAEKDNWGEAVALFNEVKKRVRYTFDPVDYDAFQTPAKTLELQTGDCFPKGTLVLRKLGHALVPVESLRVGDEIWGHTRWSTVTNTWEKGTLPTTRLGFNNGSSVRLTSNHKVWIYRCPLHHETKAKCSCRHADRELTRITVAELKVGHVLPQPERIPFGTGVQDPRRAYVEGLYLSDGWNGQYRFSISGKDGHPKEAQKREVRAICEQLGIATYWAKKSITVKDPVWARHLAQMGTHAPQKHALSIDLEEGAALHLLRGILADSGKNTNGGGSTFTSTSRELMLQTRVLLKMAGRTCSERYIVDHGGLGSNPIHRLGIREKERGDGKALRMLRVKEIIRDRQELSCFDIETDDHFVWLPEADVTVSQCDDYMSLLGAMLRSVGLKVRSRIVQTTGNSTWNHIYLMVFLPSRKGWASLDLSVSEPAGWQVPKQHIMRQRDFEILEETIPAKLGAGEFSPSLTIKRG